MSEPGPAPSIPSLDLATTREIVDELGRRHIGVVLACVKPAKDQRSPEQLADVYYRGGLVQGLGLLEFALVILRQQSAASIPTPPPSPRSDGDA